MARRTAGGRLIPAHAGKTTAQLASNGVEGAHPRSRGENNSVGRSRNRVPGSSPLTRGKPAQVAYFMAHARLIPAHAGKTPSTELSALSSPAHPRSRGENVRDAPSTAAASGSSPLTRGKLIQGAPRGARGRLIPAHAGKTLYLLVSLHMLQAHPRSRGENVRAWGASETPTGSSPLTRGKHPPRARAARRRGLIPAHAGKTIVRSFRSVPCPAHPRSRGENYMQHSAAGDAPGSSPLTRGKRTVRACRSRIRRLIPAHAGKTQIQRMGHM